MYGNVRLDPGAMGPLANSPSALRTIFAITGEKAYPQALADFIQPHVEVGELVLGSQWQETTTSANLAATGFNYPAASITVPNGYGWLVKSFAISALTGAAEILRASPGVQLINGVGGVLKAYDVEMASSPSDAAGATFVATSKTFQPWVYWPPGTVAAVAVKKITTAGSIVCNLAVEFFPVKL